MRRPMFRGLLVVAVTAAAAALTVPVAIPAAAASAPKLAGHQTSGRPASLNLAGGVRAVPVPGSRKPAVTPDGLPNGWKYVNSIYFLNVDYDYALTLQPTSSSGRLANHLYMWAFNDWNTQTWEVYEYITSNNYVFVSEDNGLCINVPGVSTTSGTQLIVYSCSGAPKNEVFNEYFGNEGGIVL